MPDDRLFQTSAKRVRRNPRNQSCNIPYHPMQRTWDSVGVSQSRALPDDLPVRNIVANHLAGSTRIIWPLSGCSGNYLGFPACSDYQSVDHPLRVFRFFFHRVFPFIAFKTWHARLPLTITNNNKFILVQNRRTTLTKTCTNLDLPQVSFRASCHQES